MTGKTHLAAGILSGEIVVLATQCQTLGIVGGIIALGAFGGLVPDIDHPHSQISKSSLFTKLISRIATSTLKHRGFTHTIWFIAMLAGITWKLTTVFNGPALYFTIAIAAGMLSHMILDTFNPTGIMWMWPISMHKFHWAKIKTGKKGDARIRLMLNFIATIGIVWIARNQVLAFDSESVRQIIHSIGSGSI